MTALTVSILALSLSAHAAPPGRATPAAPVVAEAPLPGPLAQRIRGEWLISLSAEEQRTVDLMAFAFSDPVPTDEMIKAKGLTPDESSMVAMLLAMRRANPADPQLVEMKRVLGDFPKTTLRITADTFTFGLAGQEATGRYEVVAETADAVTIRHHPPDAPAKEATLSLAGETLLMTDAGHSVRFERK